MVRRPLVALGLLAAGIAAAVGVATHGPGSPDAAPAALAAAVAAPTGFVSTSGADNASCSQTQPCKTFAAAYRAAKPGQTVEVAGGTYPQQKIPVVSGRVAPAVTFRPAAGATVTLNCGTLGTVGNGTISGATCLDIAGSYVTFDGGDAKAFRTQTYTVNGFAYQGRIDTERGCSNVTLTNVDAGAFTDACSSGFSATQSDFGPSVDPLNILFTDDVTGAYVADSLIHDFVIVNGGHFECMYWQGVTNVWLDHNEFRSCAVYGIHSKEVGDRSYSSKNARITGNVFWNPRGLTTQADVQLVNEIAGTQCVNSTVTDNVFTDGLINDCTPTTESGNVARKQTDPAPASPIRAATPPATTTSPTTTAQTTTAPATTAPTTTTAPPPAYAPACQPTCDQQIADLAAKAAAADARASALQARIDKAVADLQTNG